MMVEMAVERCGRSRDREKLYCEMLRRLLQMCSSHPG
jgi:hypothetical protein